MAARWFGCALVISSALCGQPGTSGHEQVAIGGRIISTPTDSVLQAVDSGSGRVVWRTDLRAAITTPIVIARSSIYVATADGAVYYIEPSAGVVQASYRSPVTSIPASLTASATAISVRMVDAAGKCIRIVSLDLGLTEQKAEDACPATSAAPRTLTQG